METTRRRTWIATIAILAGSGCGGSSGEAESSQSSTASAGGEQSSAPQVISSPGANATAGASAGDAGSAPAELPQPSVTVTAATPTPVPENLHPRVQITAPRDNATVRTNSVEVRLRVTDWPAPQDGRHVHLILDNEPYQRVDDPSRPVRLQNLAEGTHVLRAFPGWATHESVKRDGAFALVVFHVGHPTPNFGFNRTAPLLTYSRPKGDYNGTDGDHVLLDFYVSNIPDHQLSPSGFRVRYSIDGTVSGEAAAWVPHFIDHLQDGAHTVTLDLLGPDGQPVAGPFNHIERTIQVNHSAPTPESHQHAASPTPTGDAGTSPAP